MPKDGLSQEVEKEGGQAEGQADAYSAWEHPLITQKLVLVITAL